MVKCLITRKEFGEEIREYIIENKLLNNNFKITREKNHLNFPLNKNPSEIETIELLKIDESIVIKDCIDLHPTKDIPNSHLEALEGILSEHELALAPRSFDTIGDIVIVEIPDDLWEKRVLIGKALMQAHKSIKSVFVKTGKVEGVNRIRPVEYLVGDKKSQTIYKEHGVRLLVDITAAYFSPRLSQEHSRIANKVKNHEKIVDLFCGIGPFALPIAKNTSSIVYAIDINPVAIELLKRNIQMNKLKGEIIPLSGDCRVVVEKENLAGIADRAIMNLPGYAINFVDVACKVIKQSGGVIHFFEFVGGEDPERIIIDDITREVQKSNRQVKEVLEVRKVRVSAPRQWQMVADVLIK